MGRKKKGSKTEALKEFPWCYLLTSAIVDLGKDESWFWSTEPRIVISLINEKKKMDIEKMKTQSAYIACCVWGKNMDELDGGKEKKVLGIDEPVNPSLLKGFY